MSSQETVQQPDEAIVEALRLLGKRRLSLAIHDGSFPGLASEDIGRGSPYSDGAKQFLAFARRLGFDAVQLGPQGQTARDNPSPYDGSLFSRNILNLDVAAVANAPGGLLGKGSLRHLLAGGRRDRAHSDHRYAFDASHAALDEIYDNFIEHLAQGDASAIDLKAELTAFATRQADWLDADALYHALGAAHGGRHYRDWPVFNDDCTERDLYRPAPGQEDHCASRRAVLQHRYQTAIERYQLGQLLLHRQHTQWRALLNGWGLRLYGDLQVGLSPCDAWSRGAFYLQDYRMGAPPSRTNPLGQPWGYGVFNPEQYLEPRGEPGPVMRFLLARVNKMLTEFDGIRIDHPHGLVCPWVYRNDDPDPYHAVQHGARLFSSPQLPEHPGLARYAIVTPEQLNTTVPRYADDWVQSLRRLQVERYALLLDAIVDAVRAHGASNEDVLCEVLSTLPYPLARVIARQGLGRFRVTQKADLDNPLDVYRSENAHAEDWIMVGNHDTPPVWHLVRQWVNNGQAGEQARYLAQRLVAEEEREAFAKTLASDWRKLAHAKLADIFASPAAHVMVFFADLLGLEEIYNRPGITDPGNWTLRVPQDYATRYARAVTRGEALNLPCVLALALRAQGEEVAQTHAALIARLQALAGWSIT